MTMERALHAMRVTYFHWGFHGWAVYVIVGLCLAYFGFRKKLPLTLRSALYPIIGERIYGPIGHAVDLLAVFGTVFGVATSLGLGVSQMAAGLNVLFGVDPGCHDTNHSNWHNFSHRDAIGCFRRWEWHSHNFRMEHLAVHCIISFLPVWRTVSMVDGAVYHITRRLSVECDSNGILDCWNRG